MKTGRLNSILAYLRDNPQSSSKAIFDALPDLGGYATVKRNWQKLLRREPSLLQDCGKRPAIP